MGQADQRPRQDIGEDQIVGRAMGDAGVLEARRRHAVEQGRYAVELRIQLRHAHRFRINVGGERFAFCGKGGGNGQHARAAAEIQNALRPPPFQNRIKGKEAAGRGAVVAGAKCGSRINFKRHAAMAPAFAVMGAVQKKPPRHDGRQAFKRMPDPILVRQFRNDA